MGGWSSDIFWLTRPSLRETSPQIALFTLIRYVCSIISCRSLFLRTCGEKKSAQCLKRVGYSNAATGRYIIQVSLFLQPSFSLLLRYFITFYFSIDIRQWWRTNEQTITHPLSESWQSLILPWPTFRLLHHSSFFIDLRSATTITTITTTTTTTTTTIMTTRLLHYIAH
jgi:hypothetical protein